MSIATPLKFKDIRNKKDLVRLYLSQMTENFIIGEINKILKAQRTALPFEQRHWAKNLFSKEVLIFIYKYGAPDGYVLSQEMQVKLAEVRIELVSSGVATVGEKNQAHED